jgi:hypothetical protein
MLNLNELGVDIFIKRAKDISPYWENYDLIIWEKNISGFTSKKGLYRNNSWGTAEVVSINNKGIWELPKKYVKYFK